MPISKITAPSETPSAVDDYQAQNALLSALLLAVQGAERIVGSNVVKGAVFQVGGATYLATADTAISGSASDYVKLTVSVDGLSLAPSYVADLTGVTWSSTYNGYYDVDGNLYIFDELKAYAAGTIVAKKLAAIGWKNVGAGWEDALIVALGTGWPTKFSENANSPSGAVADTNVAENRCDGFYYNNSTSIQKGDTGYVIAKRYIVPFKGTVSITFDLSRSGSAGTAYGRLYVNGSAVGTERSLTTGTTSYTETITVNAGDAVEVYLKVSLAGVLAITNLFSVQARLTQYLGALTTF